jgi:hypothetical protein
MSPARPIWFYFDHTGSLRLMAHHNVDRAATSVGMIWTILLAELPWTKQTEIGVPECLGHTMGSHATIAQ